MPYADVLTKNYLLPQNRYQPLDRGLTQATLQPEIAQPSLQLPEVGVGDLDLAEDQADQFHNTKGQIRALALDMAQKGIDVTKPDYSQPGGGLPYKTYLKMAADLQLQADRLVQSRKSQVAEADALRKGEIRFQPGFDPSQQLSDGNPLDRYFSTDLLPEVVQANAIFKSPVYNATDKSRRDELYKQTVDRINSRNDLTPAEKYYQVNALVQSSQETDRFAQRGNPYNNLTVGQEAEIEAYDVFLRDINNQLSGRWSDFTKSTDAEGKAVAMSERMAGEQLGQARITDSKTGNVRYVPRIVDRWIKYPNGDTFIQFAPADNGQEIPPLRVDNKDPLSLATEFVSSNTKYGDAQGLRKAAVLKGYIGPKEATIKREALNDPTLTPVDMSVYQPAIEQEIANVKSQLGATGDETVDRPSRVEFELPNGEKVVAKRHKHLWRTGWYIEGTDKQELSDDQMINHLKEKGYFDKVFDENFVPDKVVNQTVPQSPPIKSDSTTVTKTPSVDSTKSTKKSFVAPEESEIRRRLIYAKDGDNVSFDLPDGTKLILKPGSESGTFVTDRRPGWIFNYDTAPSLVAEMISNINSNISSDQTTQQISGVVSDLPAIPNETQAQYDLRKIRHLRSKPK